MTAGQVASFGVKDRHSGTVRRAAGSACVRYLKHPMQVGLDFRRRCRGQPRVARINGEGPGPGNCRGLVNPASVKLQADFGNSHQVATLGHILHSEGIERSRALLRRTHAALAPGGTIAIAEFLVDADRRGPLNGLIFAVNMLVNTESGNTYSFDEIAG